MNLYKPANKKHKYLLGIISFASMATIVFQCFWLYTNYQNVKEGFLRLTDRMVFESILYIQAQKMEKLYPEFNNQLKKRIPQHTWTRDRPLRLPLPPPSLFRDSITLLNKADIYEIEKRLNKAFIKENINVAFKIKLVKEKNIEPSLINNIGIKGYSLHGNPILLDPREEDFLILYTQHPTFWILKQLSGIMITSFLLMVLTVGCLIYMLYTIFQEKKIADMRTDLVNNMTHELKTPVATVMIAIESIQQPSINRDKLKNELYLQLAYNAALHLSQMIDQVLFAAQNEAGNLYIKRLPINTEVLIQNLIESKKMLTKKPFELKFIAHNKPFQLNADPFHLKNALENLLDNAIKYSENEINIEINESIIDGKWVLTITDSGIGIPKDSLAYVLQPFYRVPTGNLHSVKGFGLGLYYVQQVIKKHEGNFTIDSIIHKGTTCTIQLPINITT